MPLASDALLQLCRFRAASTPESRGESGWCSDVTSTHGAWEHAGVRFLLSGVTGDRTWAVSRGEACDGCCGRKRTGTCKLACTAVQMCTHTHARHTTHAHTHSHTHARMLTHTHKPLPPHRHDATTSRVSRLLRSGANVYTQHTQQHDNIHAHAHTHTHTHTNSRLHSHAHTHTPLPAHRHTPTTSMYHASRRMQCGTQTMPPLPPRQRPHRLVVSTPRRGRGIPRSTPGAVIICVTCH